MIAYAAVDLRAGQVVQWEGGDPAAERVVLQAAPAAVARRWIDQGLSALHVVDLDAALGRGENHEAVRSILQTVDVPVQVGGGIRDDAAAACWLAAGAARIVLGTGAMERPDWLAAITRRYPDRVVVAADMNAGRVLARGWTADAGLDVDAFLASLESLPLAAVLVTDVAREGRMRGVDAARFGELAAATRHRLLAAGGIACMADLHALARAGIAGAVLGMALYTGALDTAAVAAEFGADQWQS
ncbi:MAG: HisA/HisF-related TIM barrel protein [Longimicrobiales bacterium]